MSKLISGFLPLQYKLKNSSVIRELFVKQHEGNNEVKPSEKTLYMVGLPQYFNDECLKYLFTEYGTIEKIYIHHKPTSGEGNSSKPVSKFFNPPEPELGSKVGYIVFKNPSSIRKVFAAKGITVVPRTLFEGCVGKKKWIKEYNSSFVDPKELQEEIDTFMGNFDKSREEEKKKIRETEGEPDEEGWVTVTKYSKKPKIPRIESVSKRILEKQKNAEKKLSQLKFYRNQLRDAKMDEIIELRKKFEQDKVHIEEMRANRKFRPF